MAAILLVDRIKSENILNHVIHADLRAITPKGLTLSILAHCSKWPFVRRFTLLQINWPKRF